MGTSTVGFVGIGSMGWPMAARLVAAGFDLVVADRDSARADRFAAEHDVCSAAANAAFGGRCDVVVTMLPTSAIVDDALLGPDGIANGMAAGRLVLEMSSGVPVDTIRIANRLEQRGFGLVDAPVSGGVSRATVGELSIMAGGNPADLERARPLLDAMGRDVLRTGGVGSGHAMKALNNLVSAAGFVAGVEALLIGRKFGLDPKVMVDVLNASTGTNNSTQKKFHQYVLSETWQSGFGLDLMLKDLGIALDLAKQSRAAAPLSAVCLQIWESARNVLGPGRDHTEVARLSSLLAAAQLGTAGDRDGGS